MPIVAAVVKCKKCNFEIRCDWKFCPNCGDRIMCTGKYKEMWRRKEERKEDRKTN